MISLKHIPKLISRNTSGSTACLINSYQKSFFSTAATATNFTEYSSVEADIDQHDVISTFNLYSIGFGPSSSRIVGPMSASKIFINDLKRHNILDKVYTLRVDMFGSLALTGKTHGTPEAILMGIEGETPEAVETSSVKSRVQDIYSNQSIYLDGTHNIHFNPGRHLVFNYFKNLPQHLDGIRFCAFDSEANMIATNKYFIHGGYIVNEETQIDHVEKFRFKLFNFGKKSNFIEERRQQGMTIINLPFKNAEDLIHACRRKNITFSQIAYENKLKRSIANYYDENTTRLRKRIVNTN